MIIQKGAVVYSTAGRDKAKFLAVLSTDGDYALLSDGSERPLERPKRKNIKHISLTKQILTEGEMSTNRALRRALKSN